MERFQEVTQDKVIQNGGLNGSARARDWREAALDEALHAESISGQSIDALLRAVRQHRASDPNASRLTATLMLWLDKQQTLRFLRERCEEFTAITPGQDTVESDEQLVPYIGWYLVRHGGATYEIALAPDSYKNGHWLILGESEASLSSFAKSLREFANRPAGRSLRYTMGWENAPDLDRQLGQVTWDDLVLAPEQMAGVREAVEGFVKSRDAFQALGFAWRRGVLLVGPPGTGKTMICKAAAAALGDWPFLYVRDLVNNENDEAIRSIFERARALAPCLLVFEDIDGLVHEGNRTVLLNEMDGFRSNEGVLIIASSNHPGKIDEALLKRPSRFDRVFHIGLPKHAERAEYCRRLLSRGSLADRLAPEFDVEKLAEAAAQKTDGFTPAYLKEAFTAAALSRAQGGAMVLDEAFAEAVLTQIGELRDHLKRTRDPEAMASLGGFSESMGLRKMRD